VKSVSSPLASLINGGVFYDADLYSFTSVLGPTIRLTTADFDAYDNVGNVYSSGSIGSGSPKIDLKESKVQGHWTRGLDSDQWLVALMPTTQDAYSGAFTYPDVVGGTPWLAACRAGLFDGAACVVQRAYWATPPVPPYTRLSRTPVGTLTVFSGLVGQVDCNQTVTFFTINDYKYLLGMTMPRNLYQSSCRNVLGDARCKVNLPSFARSAAAQAGTTPSSIIAAPGTPGGSGTFQRGLMMATTGLNEGFSRTIAAVTGSGTLTFQPQYPFPFPIGIGDSFTFTPGCDRSMGSGGCAGFSNIANFRGEPRIPVPEVQVG
jgi:uncharacterized phage protein (TIGR02218 family)